MRIVYAVFSVSPVVAKEFTFSDSFDVDTRDAYNWRYVDARSHYGYDSLNQWMWVTLSDDWPYIIDPVTGEKTSCKLVIEKQLDTSLVSGHAEYKFYATRTYPHNGGVQIKMYSSSDPTDSYSFSILKSPPRHYNTYYKHPQ